jgi:hypothetical protein
LLTKKNTGIPEGICNKTGKNYQYDIDDDIVPVTMVASAITCNSTNVCAALVISKGAIYLTIDLGRLGYFLLSKT